MNEVQCQLSNRTLPHRHLVPVTLNLISLWVEFKRINYPLLYKYIYLSIFVVSVFSILQYNYP